MPKTKLPAYAIVELLMRLSNHNKAIGDYKTHREYADHALVKTTGGTIRFARQLVIQQFEEPALISEYLLAETAAAEFVPFTPPKTI